MKFPNLIIPFLNMVAVLPLVCSHAIQTPFTLNISEAHTIVKHWNLPKPLEDETWAKFVYKGNTLAKMFSADDAGASALFDPFLGSAASRFTNFPTWPTYFYTFFRAVEP
ncbi:uncharacterized protein BDR25DRAFT_318247 [Lindgomyces ingoldianus]|uniref:Uncharacterized protein n=1 Tax=Lindgomyces ingoldianus TaxID=673940 RepID=A0ACB6QFT9_9PLEO|nr:uncharacterized protein BDR25DRAFT_318247 [Lindgomyces ingoldianus]KAF2465796.1 hypothetical protein BDR25DRAFT_318247 [Lindgomyces ingoldianus]